MGEKPKVTKMILIAGLIGIIGALITVISDLVLIGKPTDALLFFKLGTESMAGLSEWRITLGTFLGVCALPFQIAGLIVVYYGLRPAGKVVSLIVVIIAAHALSMGVAFHGAYAFIGSGWRLYYQMNTHNKIVIDLISKFEFYWRIIITIMLSELTTFSILFAFIILKRKTLYPKWMSILNPLCVSLFIFPLVYIIPAPVGGFIASTYLNLCTILFFVSSTIAVYKKLEKY
jgi:hypothetical protein